MHWRPQELSEVMPDAEWLPEAEAHRVYERIAPLLGRDHYGLDPKVVHGLQRSPAGEASGEWLRGRIPAGTERVLLVFGPGEVCRASMSGFIEHWNDLLRPSRDDVVIVGESDDWALYYYHEEQFEFGETRDITHLKAVRGKRIAARLLTLLASGGTLERAITELPAFKAQIESAFEWMKSNAQCTTAEITARSDRLRELIRRKDEACRNQDFELAAEMRAEECALVKSLGLRARGEDWNPIMDVEHQMRDLSAVLTKSNEWETDPPADPSTA